MNSYQAKITHIESVGTTYVILTCAKPPGFEYEAGQHTRITFEDSQGSFERFYSIASPPHFTDRLEFCVQLLSDGRSANIINQLKIGDSLTLAPAQGSFKVIDSSKPLTFIAGGSGIGPLRSLFLDLLTFQRANTPIWLLYGCKEANIIPFYQELKNLQNTFLGRFYVAFYAEQGPHSLEIKPGNILQSLDRADQWLSTSHHFYLCGPNRMNEEVIRKLSILNIPRDQIFKEY